MLIDWVRLIVLIGGPILYIILTIAMHLSLRMVNREVPNDVNSDPKRGFNAGPVRSFRITILITVPMTVIAIILLLASNDETMVGQLETSVGICLMVFSNMILATAAVLACDTILFRRGWRVQLMPPVREILLEKARSMRRRRPVKS